MKLKLKKLYLQNKKRALKKIKGTDIQPRLSIFKSHKHIYAQLINDQKGHTLTFSSTLEKINFVNDKSTATQEAAFFVGVTIAKKALKQHLNKIVFDRGNFPYHGRIKSLAEGARKQGLIF